MATEKTPIEGTVDRAREVDQIRKAARHFAMLYFHLSKTLYENFGLEKAKILIQTIVFELGEDRALQMKEKAKALGLTDLTHEDFMKVVDIPFDGWIKEWGENHCPYAEVWRKYIPENPWFQELAPFYCDVIDTTTTEVFTGRESQKITQNVITHGTACLRNYFEKEEVKKGEYTYGKR
ncbi:MAG: hypothetical protein IKR39_09895 [Lachnospiraceae bacterium]|nr:hypothetical protein [Lachnospiraceae bacterium]